MADGETVTEQTTEAPKPSFSLLARDMFGANFHGEVKEPEPATPAEPADDDQEETDTASDAETEQEAEGESKDEGEEDSGESEQVPISSLQELIEHNEWDPEWVNTLKVPVKVDGKQSEATLKDLVDGFQMREMAEKYLEEAKTTAKAREKDAAEKAASIEEQYAIAGKLIQSAESLLDADTKAIDWQTLRVEDPAEYSAKKAEIAERRQEIETMKREAVEAWQKSKQTQAGATEEDFHRHLQSEREALLEKIPEWRDSEKAKAEQAEIVQDLMDRGFSREDALGASDHRLVLLARDALLYRKTKANSDVARKKVAKVPKVLKPGAPKPQDQQDREKLKQLKDRAAKTGNRADAEAYLRARRGLA